jgi:hypothetical protein
MKNYTYNFEIRNMIVQFMAALDDIIISRYDKEREEQSRIKARVVYAPKQRVLADLLDKAQTIQLPVVSVYITGVNRDEGRVYNKIHGTMQNTGSGTAKLLKQPSPIDIGVGVTILTRFQEDMDQILTNMVPYFDPYIIISWRAHHDPLYEIRSQVMWSGAASIQYPYDVAAAQSQRVQAELSFTIKGWLFKGDVRDGGDQAPRIFTVNSSYSTEMNKLNGPYVDNGGLPYSSSTTDYFSLSSNPVLLNNSPKTIPALVPFPTLISVSAKSLKGAGDVYLMSFSHLPGSTLYDAFSAIPSLSAVYPAISALKVENYVTDGDSNLTFVFPLTSTVAGTTYDIVIENAAGRGILSSALTAIA